MQHLNRRLFATLLAFLAGSLVLTTAHAQASLIRVSGPSPFSGCIVDALTLAELGELNYLNAEVEPFVAVDARNPQHFVGVWQQDRSTFGGPRGLVTGVSHDGGTSWTTAFPHFSHCAGGTASNGGNYERASDPWVTIAPNGDVYQIALQFDVSLRRVGSASSRARGSFPAHHGADLVCEDDQRWRDLGDRQDYLRPRYGSVLSRQSDYRIAERYADRSTRPFPPCQ
jgi:hypothetical protein